MGGEKEEGGREREREVIRGVHVVHIPLSKVQKPSASARARAPILESARALMLERHMRSKLKARLYT